MDLPSTQMEGVGFGGVYSFPRATVTICHRLGCLETIEVYRLPVLEAYSPKLRCQQGHPFSEALRKDPPLPLLASSGYIPWHFLACRCIPPILASVVTGHSPCVFVQFPSSYKDTSHWSKAHPYPV